MHVIDERNCYCCTLLRPFGRIIWCPWKSGWNAGDVERDAVGLYSLTLSNLTFEHLPKLVSWSVSVLAPNTLADRSLLLNNPRSPELINMPNIGGWLWLPVRRLLRPMRWHSDVHVCLTDTMIDSGFVIAAFVPLVLFWM